MKRPSLTLLAGSLLCALSGAASAAPVNFFSAEFYNVPSIGELSTTPNPITSGNPAGAADYTFNRVESAQYQGTDSYTLNYIRFTTNNPATTDPDVSADGVVPLDTPSNPSVFRTWGNELGVQITRTGVLDAPGFVNERLGDGEGYSPGPAVFFSAAGATLIPFDDPSPPGDGNKLTLPHLTQLLGELVTDSADTFFFRFYEAARDNATPDGTPLPDARYNYIGFEFWGELVSGPTPPNPPGPGGTAPEPATLALLGLGLIGLGFSRRRLF